MHDQLIALSGYLSIHHIHHLLRILSCQWQWSKLSCFIEIPAHHARFWKLPLPAKSPKSFPLVWYFSTKHIWCAAGTYSQHAFFPHCSSSRSGSKSFICWSVAALAWIFLCFLLLAIWIPGRIYAFEQYKLVVWFKSHSLFIPGGARGAGPSYFQRHKQKCVFNKCSLCQMFLTVSYVVGPPCLAHNAWRCPCISVVPKQRTHQGWGPLKGIVSAQKALQESEKDTRELLEERKRIVFLWQGVIDLPYRQINDFLPFWPP